MSVRRRPLKKLRSSLRHCTDYSAHLTAFAWSATTLCPESLSQYRPGAIQR
jgi:hypothetical protein